MHTYKVDQFLFVVQCILKPSLVMAKECIITNHVNGSYVYRFQYDHLNKPMSQQVDITWVPTKQAKRNRAKLHRQLKAMYAQGIINSFTITDRHLTINWDRSIDTANI